MKLVKLASGAAAVLAATVLGASSVFAGSPGQLAQGAGSYVVKNLTQGGSYASSVTANACDELQFSMQLSNTDFGALNNVTLTATLPSGGGTSTATATTDLGGNSGTHDSVTFSVPSGQTISYEADTTTLYNGSGSVIQTLPNTVTTSGVNVGTINGSTTEYVNFKAKVSCTSAPVPTPTPTPAPTPTPTPAKPVSAAKPAALPNTGPGDVLGIFAGASAAGTAAHMAVTARRNRK